MRRLAIGLVCLLLAALSSSSALGASSNVASTASYLRANYVLVSSGHAKIHLVEARLAGLLARVRSECPRVVVGSPQNEESEQLTWEVIGTMTITAYQPGAQAAAKFARAVGGLRWGNAKLTGAVRQYARQLNTEVNTPLPNICADLRQWAASGYTKLPQSTIAFKRTFYENYVGIGFVPKPMLAPYLRPTQSALLQRTHKYELELLEVEARAVETFGKLIDSLGLNQ